MHHILISNGLEVNHRRGQITVPQPELQGADVADSFLQVSSGKGMPEFVQEES